MKLSIARIGVVGATTATISLMSIGGIAAASPIDDGFSNRNVNVSNNTAIASATAAPGGVATATAIAQSTNVNVSSNNRDGFNNRWGNGRWNNWNHGRSGCNWISRGSNWGHRW